MEQQTRIEEDRREFLKKAGRFAAITPPAVTFLLSTTMSSKAIAGSGGRPGWGHGDTNHGHSGPPGQSSQAAAAGKAPKGKQATAQGKAPKGKSGK